MDPTFGSGVSWDRPCAYCQGNKVGDQIVGFSLPHYLGQDPATEPAAIIAQSLEQVGALRHGSLYRCRHCGRPWLEVGDGFCAAMSKRDVPVVIRWDDHSLAPDAHLSALAAIGATRGHSFIEALEVPAMVRVGSKWLDPCRVRLQNAPPLTAGHPSVIFIDEVERIEPTEFALPLELRENSHNVPERNMGFAPFDVYWGQLEIKLNGIQDLWGEAGMMGSDLAPKPQEHDWIPSSRRPRELARLKPPIVIADLDEHSRSALIHRPH
jgi:hypothetical protein